MRRATVSLSLVLMAAALGAGPGGASGGLTPLPRSAPWEFLDATNQVAHPAPHSGFRAASEGDLDNDGDLDVVVVQNVTSEGVVGTPAPSLLYMNEGGRFVDRTAALLPQLLTPQVTWWSNIHDFDVPPDGWRDIFVPGGGGEPSRLYRNRGRDGNGQFLGFEDASTRIDGPLAVATHCYHSHKGDFDNDGAMDMFVYQYRSDLGAQHGQNRLLMNRNGILVDETVGRLPIRSEPGIFGHTEDLNGDGFIDISQVNLKNGLVPGVPQAVPSIRVLINDGTGRFPTSLEQPMPERSNPLSSFGAYSLEHADLNGDGWLDIYVINWGLGGNGARDAVLVNSRNPAQLFPAAGIYYPEIAAGDGDGDHPVARDLNGDGRLDVVVAQFSQRTYVLRNETRDGVLRLLEATPPEMPTGDGFRAKSFDANGDGQDDVWLALRTRNHLMLSAAAEREPNDSTAAPDGLAVFPALRTGALGGPRTLEAAAADAAAADGAAAGPDPGDGELRRDVDVFRLPARAISEGAVLRLRPAADSDLMLVLRDAAGTVVATSQQPGPGAVEQMVLGAGTPARFAQVDRQAAGGSGTYRLDMGAAAAVEAAVPPPSRRRPDGPRRRGLR